MQDRLRQIVEQDVVELLKKDEEYGSSWKKRGGVGAFMMLARKWDRLEHQVASHGYDVFSAICKETREEGILDDIRDLRRYLLLVEQEFTANLPRQSPKGRVEHPAPFGYDAEECA